MGSLLKDRESCKFVIYIRMMVFSYYNRIEKEGIVATNLKSISEQTGIKYHTLVNWFREKRTRYADEDIIIFKTEVVRGNQRLKDNGNNSKDAGSTK